MPDEPVTCDASGHQLARDGAGIVTATGRICTVRVVVDDETSIPCTTKADGTQRCWSNEGATPLPVDDYVQVQQGTNGYVALTRDGRIVAPDMQPPHLTAPVRELSSTNMWGARSLCYRTESPGPLWIWHPNYNPDIPLEGELLRTLDAGPFEQSLCAYEGLAYGLKPDHQVWALHDGSEEPSEFVQIAGGIFFVCGLELSGSVSCLHGFQSLAPGCAGGYPASHCADPLRPPTVPVFPTGTYTQVATTRLVACAITTAHALVCVRGDGQPLPTIPGKYWSVAAGGNVMCAIRVDGTTACFRHGESQLVSELSQLESYEPAPSADW